MSLNWNNVKPACCAKWLVLPTVYSDALSYGEQLDKFCYQLNQLIENNNILPDFIAEMIKEYINSGAIGEVVRDILANYILNVKYPPDGITPAVGDGSADDTEAIQGCIDYAAENGGVVYFPYGSYLTQPLTMKDGVSLFGFDRYSTKIVLKGGATKPLIGGSVADLSIANLTLDGNSGIQVNDVNVVTIAGTNVLLTNLIIKDGYTLVNYAGTGGHLQISDVVFGNAVERCLLIAGNADVQCENVVFNQLSAVGGISVMDIGTDGGFFNVKSVATCNQCIVITGNNNKISAIVENAAIPVVDNGLQNNIEIFGISNKEFYSGNKTVNAVDSKEILTGNKTVNAVGSVEKFTGNKTVNAVDSKETLTGNKTVNAVNSVETLTGDKNVKAVDSVETLTGNKTVNAVDSKETLTGNKTVKAVDSAETLSGNKTINSVDSLETLTGKKTVNAVDLKLNITNPIQYKTPTAGKYFDTIPFKDANKHYNVLVENKNTGKLGSDSGKVLVSEIKASNPEYDDDELLNAAINVAKTMTPPGKIEWDGSDIHFNSSHFLSEIGGIDFNGSRIYMPSSDIDILIVNPTGAQNKNVDASKLNKFGTTDPSLYNKYFAINSSNDGANSMFVGTRPTTTDKLYICEGLITNENGKFINECAYYLPSSGTIPLYNVHEIPKNRFDIGNCELIYSNEVPTFLVVNRSNSYIHDIKVSGSLTPSNYRTGAISCGRCCLIEIARIIGNNPVLEPTSGYILSLLNGCSNVYVHDCLLYDGNGKSWGCIGTNCLTNAVFERCSSNRFDVHYFSWGYLHIVDCTCDYIGYACGCGEIVISNTTFIGYDGLQAFILLRSDSPGYFNGNVIIENCVCHVPNGVDSISFFREYDFRSTPTDRVNTNVNKAVGMRVIKNCVIKGARRLMDLGTVNDYTLDISYVLDGVDFSNNFNGIYANNYDHTFTELIIQNSHIDTPNLSSLPVNNTKIINSKIETLQLSRQGLLQIIGCIINNLYNDRLSKDSNVKALMVGSVVPSSIVTTNLSTYSFYGNTTNDYTNMNIVNKHSA